MSQDPEPLVLWKHEPKPKKPMVLWKHKPRSKNPRSLKTWAKIQNLWFFENMSQSPKNLWSSEHMSQDPKILGLWKHEPGSITFGPLKTWAKIHRPPGKHILYSFKKKKKKKFTCTNYIWTWSPHQEVRRQSFSRFGPHFDSQHDHLHFYLHAFTTVKYCLQN